MPRTHVVLLLTLVATAAPVYGADPIWTQQQKLMPSDGLVSGFGMSVSVSGDTAVVGAAAKNNSQGSAYVFVRTAGAWTQQQELTASDGAAGDNFGTTLSLSGDTVVVGVAAKNGNQGAAYVFVRSGGVWSQQQKLSSPDSGAASFGGSVSVSGDTVVIGAAGSFTLQGAAYVFVRSEGAWSEQQKLTAANGWAADSFGNCVSVSGDTAVIGSPWFGQGVPVVFQRSGGVWSQQQQLAPSDGTVGSRLGSLSISGDTAIVGARGTSTSQGAAYIFVKSGGVWSQQQKLTASAGAAGDGFGGGVSVSGDTVAIGALPQNSSLGAEYVFTRTNGVWSQQQVLKPGGTAFGICVAVSGNTTVVGAVFEAYVFVRPALGAGAVLVGSSEGASSVVLTASDAWTATANDSFLHISPGSTGGTGSAVVMFTYDAFAGPGARTGTLTVAGLPFTVTQAGPDYLGAGPVIPLLPSGTLRPQGMAVAGSGDVYIADFDNKAIKKWNARTQQLETVVSLGLSSPYGVAVDSFGNIFIADLGDSTIKVWSALTQQLTTLVSSGLNAPHAVAVDTSGNVFIADSGNNALKEWNASTRQVTTLASGFLNILGVAVDGADNVYVSVLDIKKWNPSTQQLTPLMAMVGGPNPYFGVAVDGFGNVYAADPFNKTIRQWSASTGQITALPTSALSFPQAVAVDASGNVFIANGALLALPHVFAGPASLTETASAGTDALLPVLPATTDLTGVFAPVIDHAWLAIDAIANGVIHFTFTANLSAARVAHITVLGHQIPVAQNAAPITCDSNSDQVANVIDAQVVIDEALNLIAKWHDLNNDGLVDWVDVKAAVTAALGLGCPVQ